MLGLVDAAKMGVECDVLGSETHLRDLAALRRLAIGEGAGQRLMTSESESSL